MFGVISKHTTVLILVILLGAILRLAGLGSLPAGFHGDEAAYGYNAYSLLTTGTDEYGVRYPLILKSFEDYKPALYSYIDIPFVALLGLNEVSVRLPSAIFGTLTLLILYLLVKKLFDDKTLATTAAFVLSISPWHIMLSRTTSEVVISVFFLLVMLFSLSNLRRLNEWKWIMIAIIAGALSLSSYTAARMFVPIVAGATFVFSLSRVKKKFTINAPILIVCIAIIIIELLYNQIAVNNRFSQVSIFNNATTKLLLEEQIREDEFVSVGITRLFHNKFINYARVVFRNYSEYFSLDFLALTGGFPWRQRVVDTGGFFLWQILFLGAGIYQLLRAQKRNGLLILVLWPLLLLPSSITSDDVPNVYRTLVTVPILCIIIAVGLVACTKWIYARGKMLTMLIVFVPFLAIALYEGAYFAHQYLVHSERHQPWHRDYAMKGLVEALNIYDKSYKKILITKNKVSYIHFLFYNKIDPKLYQKSGSQMDKDFTGFGKYTFIPKDCSLTYDTTENKVLGAKDTLYVEAGTCKVPPANAEVLATIKWGDNTPAYRILRYIP